MAQKSKAYRAAAEKIEADKFYTPTEAVTLAKETGSAKFNSHRRGRAQARRRPPQGRPDGARHRHPAPRHR